MTAAICALLLGASGARAEEGGGSPPSSPLAAFDELFSRLTDAQKAPPLHADVAAAAEELRFGLRTDLVRSEAEIEVLKLEAARYSGERQEAALDGLVRAATARERRLWVAIRQLEGLVGGTACVGADIEIPGDAGEKKGGLQISFEAQDVIEDPDP